MYSEIIRTEKGQYRYNYGTGQLEQLTKAVQKETIQGVAVPVVREIVGHTVPLRREAFEKCPQYWAELMESQLDRPLCFTDSTN